MCDQPRDKYKVCNTDFGNSYRDLLVIPATRDSLDNISPKMSKENDEHDEQRKPFRQKNTRKNLTLSTLTRLLLFMHMFKVISFKVTLF